MFASEEYKNELELFTLNIKEDKDNKVSLTGLFLQYYFVPVSTQEKPLNEADFLNRAGSISVAHFDSKFDGEFDADTESWAIFTTLAKQNIPWVLDLAYINQDGKFTTPEKFDTSDELFPLGLGYFIADELLVSGQYTKSDTETSTVASNNKFESTAYEAHVKWLRLLSAQTAFNFEVGVETVHNKNGGITKDGRVLKISGDYYFTPETSAGLSYFNLTHDDKSAEGSLFGVTAKHFVTPHFSIDAHLEWFNADSVNSENNERWNLALAYRF